MPTVIFANKSSSHMHLTVFFIFLTRQSNCPVWRHLVTFYVKGIESNLITRFFLIRTSKFFRGSFGCLALNFFLICSYFCERFEIFLCPYSCTVLLKHTLCNSWTWWYEKLILLYVWNTVVYRMVARWEKWYPHSPQWRYYFYQHMSDTIFEPISF